MPFQDATLYNRLTEFAEGYSHVHPLSATLREAARKIVELETLVSEFRSLQAAEQDDLK